MTRDERWHNLAGNCRQRAVLGTKCLNPSYCYRGGYLLLASLHQMVRGDIAVKGDTSFGH